MKIQLRLFVAFAALSLSAYDCPFSAAATRAEPGAGEAMISETPSVIVDGSAAGVDIMSNPTMPSDIPLGAQRIEPGPQPASAIAADAAHAADASRSPAAKASPAVRKDAASSDIGFLRASVNAAATKDASSGLQQYQAGKQRWDGAREEGDGMVDAKTFNSGAKIAGLSRNTAESAGDPASKAVEKSPPREEIVRINKVARRDKIGAVAGTLVTAALALMTAGVYSLAGPWALIPAMLVVWSGAFTFQATRSYLDQTAQLGKQAGYLRSLLTLKTAGTALAVLVPAAAVALDHSLVNPVLFLWTAGVALGHAWEEASGHLWSYFGRVSDYDFLKRRGPISGFVLIVFPAVALQLWAAWHAFVGGSPIWLGVLIGARIGDAIFSHFRPAWLGFLPNPGLPTARIYIVDGLVLAALFAGALLHVPTLLGALAGAGLFFSFIPTFTLLGRITRWLKTRKSVARLEKALNYVRYGGEITRQTGRSLGGLGAPLWTEWFDRANAVLRQSHLVAEFHEATDANPNPTLRVSVPYDGKDEGGGYRRHLLAKTGIFIEVTGDWKYAARDDGGWKGQTFKRIEDAAREAAVRYEVSPKPFIQGTISPAGPAQWW